jgi:formate hydrogenlyase subunit 3/multisubunit Na+/H+ antiporter MnhD subunit
MKKIITAVLLIAIYAGTYACPVCERNKPKTLQGITHGNAPDSSLDYVIVLCFSIVALATLIYSIKYLIKPNENNPAHIKYTLLNE